ncbi:hypothetical protein BF49_5621 [Bradyrhizobium sp.]|uniref:BglII/BstYI family type II restriction endonuclease n=1 Tax=Bradyrhizobium sp. TaxID=376 RepID=UPI0007C184C6|nr:BglII/BstYI family type II restriction endonuclease [Bradyrhizobium sp.]CUT14541.1 hypothetical protein BF49_5621 [Bradyrhizobium sp.]
MNAKIPQALRDKYEIHSYRSAAVILAESHKAEFAEIVQALLDFSITTTMIRTAGGNESDIPPVISSSLRPLGWHETIISADLHVNLAWREQTGTHPRTGKPVWVPQERTMVRKRYLDGHKIDYVKGKVAFDMEWNSKEQTFDRDLFAMATFFQSGAINVGVLLTRSESLNEVFRGVGPALDKEGNVEKTRAGVERPTRTKYGASL